MTILEEIMLHKKKEVAVAEKLKPIEELKSSEYFKRTVFSLKENLITSGSSGIISEFKRRSPSKGWINEHADVLEITNGYVKAGAAGLSVLTDEHFFGGSREDFSLARQTEIPILRKDFIAAPYQVYETKAIGADVILLIAACLSPQEVKGLSGLAKELGLEVLLELHGEEETEHICDTIDMIGINNRNLKTFEVDISRALRLAENLPLETIKIAESGIRTVEDVKTFRAAGYKGFLMGETFMKLKDPVMACTEFIKNLGKN